jgi:hypothetical protein
MDIFNPDGDFKMLVAFIEGRLSTKNIENTACFFQSGRPSSHGSSI